MEDPVPVRAGAVPDASRRPEVRTGALEVVGYGGAAAASAASTIAVGDLASESTIILTNLVTTVVLLVAGWLVGGTDRDAFHRMRSVFWFLALWSWVSAVGVAVTQVSDSLDARWVVFFTAIAAAAVALPLWLAEPRSLQFIGLFVSLLVAAGALAYAEKTERLFLAFTQTVPDTRWISLVAVAFGIGGMLLGWRGIVAPRRTSMVFSAIAMILGALIFDLEVLGGGPTTLSILLALAAAAVILGVGSMMSERALGGVGIVGVLLLVSLLIGKEVSRQGPAIVVVVIGLLAVATTIALVRFEGGARPTAVPSSPLPTPPPPRPPEGGDARG